MKCKNCGQPVRRIQPGEGYDLREYQWEHESGGLLCEIGAPYAEPEGERQQPAADPYETGYRNGEANREADIRIAVTYSRTPDELIQRLRDMTGCQDMELGEEDGD